MNKLKVAIIDVVNIHIIFIFLLFKRLNSKFTITGLYDKDFKRAELISKKFKIKKIYKKLNDLINDEEIDLIDICSPATKHYSQILTAINNQCKNIIVEKPFVTQIKQFDNLVIKRKKN